MRENKTQRLAVLWWGADVAKESIAEAKTQLRNDVRLRLTTIMFNQMAL